MKKGGYCSWNKGIDLLHINVSCVHNLIQYFYGECIVMKTCYVEYFTESTRLLVLTVGFLYPGHQMAVV